MRICLLLVFPAQLKGSFSPGESLVVRKAGIANNITRGKCCVEEA